MPAALSENPTSADANDACRTVLASIVENTDDAIIGKTLDGRITVWNQAAAILFGYRPDEIIGQNIRKLMPADRAGEEDYIVDRLRRGERIDHYRSRRLTKDGRQIDVALTISPIRDQDGQISGASKIVRDISQQVKAEAALQKSEARFRHLANALPQLVWEANAEGETEYYNDRWYEYTGLPKIEDAVSENYWESVVHPDDLAVNVATWKASIKSGTPHRIELRILEAATGAYRWHLARGIPIRDENGAVIRWFGTCTDVEELKLAEDREKEQHSALAHMERIRSMGQMAAGLAHELNQPLGAIMNYGVGLQATLHKSGDSPGAAKAKSIIDEIVAQTARAGEIVRRMRAFVKKQRPSGEKRDINVVVRDALGMLTFDLRQARLYPALSLGKALPPVLIDEVQIQQVLVNLIRNAIDAMADTPPVQRRLKISTSAAEGFVWVRVVDGGCGISPAVSSKMFDSFFTTKEHGLGMGLALCRTIIEDHGGHMTAVANEDRGAVFSFSVRTAQATAARVAVVRASEITT